MQIDKYLRAIKKQENTVMHTHTYKEKKSTTSTVTHSFSRGENKSTTFQFEDNRPKSVIQQKQVEAMANYQPNQSIQKKIHPERSRRTNNTGLPDTLKSGIENLSSYAINDDLKMRYNSSKLTQFHTQNDQNLIIQCMMENEDNDTSKDEDSEKSEEQKKFAKENDWDMNNIKIISKGEEWRNANTSGEPGGEGQTGRKGEAIWLSQGDPSAQKYYGAGGLSGKVHLYHANKNLKVAVLPAGGQVFGDEIATWTDLFPNIEGAYTNHGNGMEELVVFNSKNLDYRETVDMGWGQNKTSDM